MDRGAVEKGAVLQRLEKMFASRYFATVSPRALSSHSQGRTTFSSSTRLWFPGSLNPQVSGTADRESPSTLSLIPPARTSCPPGQPSHSIIDCEMATRF